jgi:glutamine synthetase adenylyltransferase
MSELSDIKESINELKQIVNGHIAVTNEYRRNQEKVQSAITDAIWDKGREPGALTKLDRLIEKDKSRTWLMRTVVTAVAGLGLDRLWHLLKP